ncbi:MAG: sulfite exporter TauE/SafE family protein [Jiangellaceae bacterium]|nr:sulfite exporter TauE/SafE family protein [Jiangellaceae bacterium]
MSGWEPLAVILAGISAGAINTVVGAGTLVTFPTLLAVGLPPVTANVSNTVGLIPGSVSAAWGYRRELAGQQSRLLRIGTATMLGAITGAVLLLALPESAFEAVVPALILLACLLVLVQPVLVRQLRSRPRHPHGGPVAWLLILVTGGYAGYFGAGQGVILIAVLGLVMEETLQHVNAVKNVLAGLGNLVAAVVFVVVADVDWQAAALIAVGTATGGIVGAGIARRLPEMALRATAVAVGLAAVALLR